MLQWLDTVLVSFGGHAGFGPGTHARGNYFGIKSGFEVVNEDGAWG